MDRGNCVSFENIIIYFIVVQSKSDHFLGFSLFGFFWSVGISFLNAKTIYLSVVSLTLVNFQSKRVLFHKGKKSVAPINVDVYLLIISRYLIMVTKYNQNHQFWLDSNGYQGSLFSSIACFCFFPNRYLHQSSSTN